MFIKYTFASKQFHHEKKHFKAHIYLIDFQYILI